MKRLFRFACTIFAAAVLSMGFTAAAANDIVDMSNTSHGYVTVNYTSSAKLKVGIQYNGGKITKYIPDTAATLNGTTGMCYDFSSLFAAMCRSEGIPCALTKGYAGTSYHAWNKVNLNGSWYQIDLTYAVTRNVKNAKTLHDCVSPLTYTNTSDTLAAAAA